MEYMIMSYNDINSLAIRVADMIEAGWKPQGGVSFEPTRLSTDGGGQTVHGRYLQAMTRKKG